VAEEEEEEEEEEGQQPVRRSKRLEKTSANQQSDEEEEEDSDERSLNEEEKEKEDKRKKDQAAKTLTRKIKVLAEEFKAQFDSPTPISKTPDAVDEAPRLVDVSLIEPAHTLCRDIKVSGIIKFVEAFRNQTKWQTVC
jgi:ATP-dependent 26S proteasome regulatory subunit